MLCSIKDCHCPIDEYKQLRKKLNNKYVCDVCWEMFAAIYQREWFQKAQDEYIAQLKKIDQLKPGRDYFKE